MTLPLRDQQSVWHPFTQHQTVGAPIAVKQAYDAYLIDHNDKRYLDLISSWWVNLHGHSHPEIAKAIYDQALTLEHVLFAGFTHEPAVSLAENILKLLPPQFSKVFYSDNGSTAVEIALKMAYQYWYNQGQQRTRFIAFEKGYHGDTLGAMSVGKYSDFFTPFHDLLFTVDKFPYPETWENDADSTDKINLALKMIEQHLEKYGKQTAALIIEPLVQGAGGMRMCDITFLQSLEKLLRSYEIVLIYDEVMTGFGRTGDYFAFLKSHTRPDIFCAAKGISGGFLPLAVTICQEPIYKAFLGNTFQQALAHGHSFTANPLGCAAGLASLKLLEKPETHAQMKMIEKTHRLYLSQLSLSSRVEKARYCGTIGAFNLKLSADYGSQASKALQTRFLERGLLIRPLGNVIYFLPPYCITETDLHQAYKIVIEEIEGIPA